MILYQKIFMRLIYKTKQRQGKNQRRSHLGWSEEQN